MYGIPPTVAIEQRLSRGGRKSTVATTTEVWHFLRLLCVKLGVQHCVHDGTAVRPQSVEQHRRADPARPRGEHVGAARAAGRRRARASTPTSPSGPRRAATRHLRVDGEFVKVDPWPRLDRFKEHTLELPVGDLVVDRRQRGRAARAAGEGARRRQGRAAPAGAARRPARRDARRHADAQGRRGQGVLDQARLPDLRHQLPRARPAHVQLQQQARLVHDLRRHRPDADARAAQGLRRLGAATTTTAAASRAFRPRRPRSRASSTSRAPTAAARG